MHGGINKNNTQNVFPIKLKESMHGRLPMRQPKSPPKTPST